MAATTSGLKIYSGKWEQAQLLRLLRRTLFGVTAKDLAAFKGKDLNQCVDTLLTTGSLPAPPINNYNDPVFTDSTAPLGKTWVNSSCQLGAFGEALRTENFKGWWMGLIINQDSSITEKMTLFWHNHFVTETAMVKDPRYSYRSLELLRTHALGNFKTLTKLVTIDPGMLVYLNGNLNSKKAPNENYGRELQELFTVGKGPDSHYTEEDVKAASRVLTGWRDNKELVSSYFDDKEHDITDKKFSAFYNNAVIKGRSGPEGAKELDDLVDIIFANRETPRFLCRKLYRWFVNSRIDEQVENEVIIPLARVLVENNFEVKPVLKALFTSEYFYQPALAGCMVKSPLDFVIGIFRAFKVQFPANDDEGILLYKAWVELVRMLALDFFQDIGDPPNVAGWPAYYQEPVFYNLWVNGDTLLTRNRGSDLLFSEGIEVERERISKIRIKFEVDIFAFIADFPEQADAGKLVDYALHFLCPIDIGPGEKASLKTKLGPSKSSAAEWADVWGKYQLQPQDNNLKKEVKKRLKKMFSSLVKLPEFQMM